MDGCAPSHPKIIRTLDRIKLVTRNTSEKTNLTCHASNIAMNCYLEDILSLGEDILHVMYVVDKSQRIGW